MDESNPPNSSGQMKFDLLDKQMQKQGKEIVERRAKGASPQKEECTKTQETTSWYGKEMERADGE